MPSPLEKQENNFEHSLKEGIVIASIRNYEGSIRSSTNRERIMLNEDIEFGDDQFKDF